MNDIKGREAQNMNDIIENVELIITDCGMWADVFKYDETHFGVEIHNGDWKHDHLFIDHILRENGYEKTQEKSLDDSEDDCYSSIHIYLAK